LPQEERSGGGRRHAARVLIADVEPLMRGAVRACLERHGLIVCGEARAGQELLEMTARTNPDVCLLGSDLPEDSFRLTAAIDARFPETAVVVFAPTETEDDVLRAVRAGAKGYVRRDTPCEKLARALSGVTEGEAVFSRRTMGRLLHELRGSEAGSTLHSPRGAVTLTRRRMQVLRLLARGATTADVAQSLSISKVTARRHCADICRKLGVHDRGSAVELFLGQLTGM
jgi:DNA-binding NarL/FixJ family response regulator